MAIRVEWKALSVRGAPWTDQHMTNIRDTEAILAVIESAIELTRKNPKPDEPDPPDGYTAWVILQELRRTGWTISRNPQ